MMNNLVSIEDLGRPVSPEEYLVVCTKTAISIELLFKTTDFEPAELIMRTLIEGSAERLRVPEMKFLQDVRKANNAMAFSGFFRSSQFQRLIQQTIENGTPEDHDTEQFYQYVADNAQLAAANAPPPGTKLN